MTCYHYLNLYCPICGKPIDSQNYVLYNKQKICLDCYDNKNKSYKRLEKYFKALNNDKLDEYYKKKKIKDKNEKEYIEPLMRK